MNYSSPLLPNEPVIDDQNYFLLAPPQDVSLDGEVKSRGYIPRDWSKIPHGSMPHGTAFPDSMLIPESDWKAIIEAKDVSKSRLSDHWLRRKFPTPDQDGTNYCWTYGVVSAMKFLDAQYGEPYKAYSAESVAAPIKGYSNSGGWGGEALEYIVENGITTEDKWPRHRAGISRSHNNATTQADRVQHKITEWWDLEGRNFSQLMSCVLQNIPVAIGLNWWRHEVCACDGVLVNGAFAIRILNSWGPSYGSQGFATLTRSKATPDDACAPRVQNVTDPVA